MTILELGQAEITIPEVPHKTVAMGADRAASFMASVLRNEKNHGQKHNIGPGISKALHRRILFYYPALAGQLRVDDETRIGGRKVAPAEELGKRLYKYERWLEDEVSALRQEPENLYGALRVAAAAHYGLVEMHPFDNGNGRVARTLMNGVLMLNTHEGMAYGIYIIPVPQMREHQSEAEILKQLSNGIEPKPTPYIQALISVGDTWNLNPLEVFIAQKWAESISDFLNRVRSDYSRRNKRKFAHNPTDQKLFDKFEERQKRLEAFIEMNIKGEHQQDRVPDFYKSSHIINPLVIA